MSVGIAGNTDFGRKSPTVSPTGLIWRREKEPVNLPRARPQCGPALVHARRQ
jgi:hypothetical protein